MCIICLVCLKICFFRVLLFGRLYNKKIVLLRVFEMRWVVVFIFFVCRYFCFVYVFKFFLRFLRLCWVLILCYVFYLSMDNVLIRKICWILLFWKMFKKVWLFVMIELGKFVVVLVVVLICVFILVVMVFIIV